MSTHECLSAIVSYPHLLQHEEAFSASQASETTSVFDVMAWMSYLDSLDDVLDSLRDGYASLGVSNATKESSNAARTTTFETAGRTFHISSAPAMGITHTPSQFQKEIQQLIRARLLVGERAVALLPGSYKLWRSHLMFRLTLLEKKHLDILNDAHGNGKEEAEDAKKNKRECDRLRLPRYLLKSSEFQHHYCATLSAYERSLVRLHKMPRIWLLYASFVATYDPERNPTAVRRIYDRALVALPASQHERVWEEYLCWVTGILPGTKTDGSGAGNVGEGAGGMLKRRGMHKVKYGFESPLVAEWRKRGWGFQHHQQLQLEGDNDENDEGDGASNLPYLSTVPTETALRILRRHAFSFDTTFREDLAMLCISRYGRFGEAASLLLQLLNNDAGGLDGKGSSIVGGGGGIFLSPHGTTRHELWLRFADVCTQHPKEAKVAGVDFDSIVRAVLKGQDAGMTAVGDGLGFEVFNKTSTAFGSTDEEKAEEEEKNESPKNDTRVLNHRLGEMEGTLWTRLAEYHVRAGEFELARSIYEEALDAITRVRDFSLVFDAYVKFEEGVIEALMELMAEDEEDEEMGAHGVDEDKEKAGGSDGVSNDDNEDLDILLGDTTINQKPLSSDENAGVSADVELAISRAEHLTSRRPLLLNRVLLRQNPHNVGEWLKRSKLYLDLANADEEGNTDMVDLAAGALEEGLKSVVARKSVNGSPCTLVLTLVEIHEKDRKDVQAARSVFERICSKNEYEFQEVEDLAQCHAAWVELELREKNWDKALNLARRAASGNMGGAKGGSKASKAAKGLSRSLRLWNLLFDLEESLGTVQTTKDSYDRALELKVATPSHVLNYASYLKDQKYFEESFAAYEKGLGLFPFPHTGATLLWKNYLTNFLERYEGSKTPRVRELFDRCLSECPSEISPEFYLMYGEYEETHGLTKRALGVYERMCNAVPASEKYTAYRLYIAKAIQFLGVTSARPIYEHAISALGDGPASRICLEYAKMETGLREIDRARTVLVYGAQLADPRRDPDYWKAWHEFEVSHGNEETFREMLRVKRSVQAAFSTVNYNAAEMGAGAPKVETLTDEGALEMIAEREGVAVNEKPLIGGFVQGKRTAEMADLGEVERRAARLREATGATSIPAGDDEIDIDDIDEEEEAEEQARRSTGNNRHGYVKGLKEKAVPASVFGGLAAKENQEN